MAASVVAVDFLDQSASSSSWTLTFANITPAAGDYVVVAISWTQNRTLTSVEDDLSEAWTALDGGEATGITNGAFYYKKLTGSETSVTLTVSGGATGGFAAIQITGVAASSALDDAVLDETYNAAATQTAVTGTATATADGIAVAAFGTYFTNNFYPASANSLNNSFNKELDAADEQGLAARSGIILGSKTYTGSGSHSVTLTTTDDGDEVWTGIALFKAATGGTGVEITGNAGTLAFSGVQATVSQAVTVTGAPGEIAFTGAAGTVSQSQDVTGSSGTVTLAGAAGVVSQAQNLTGGAGALAFSGVQAAVTYGSEIQITGTAGTVTLEGVAGTVAQAEAVTGDAGTLTFAGVPGAVSQAATITGGSGTLAFAGAAGVVAQPINLTGTPGTVTLAGVQGTVTGSVITNIAGYAGELTFTGIQGVVTQDGGISGRVIRRRRSRTPYWDEDEALSALLMQLGKHPVERDSKSLRAAAKAGLAEVIEREPVVAHYDQTGALLLETVGAQIRLQGALKAHVEVLMDDEDVIDLLQLIA